MVGELAAPAVIPRMAGRGVKCRGAGVSETELAVAVADRHAADRIDVRPQGARGQGRAHFEPMDTAGVKLGAPPPVPPQKKTGFALRENRCVLLLSEPRGNLTGGIRHDWPPYPIRVKGLTYHQNLLIVELDHRVKNVRACALGQSNAAKHGAYRTGLQCVLAWQRRPCSGDPDRHRARALRPADQGPGAIQLWQQPLVISSLKYRNTSETRNRRTAAALT
jgi:hypothetical protein